MVHYDCPNCGTHHATVGHGKEIVRKDGEKYEACTRCTKVVFKEGREPE